MASMLMATSFSTLANVKQDTFPFISCSLIENSLAHNGGDGDTTLAQHFMSGALLKEYLDRGYSLDQISSIVGAAERSQPSQEKQYHQSVIADINDGYEYVRNWMQENGINSNAKLEDQRDNTWKCRGKTGKNLKQMNDFFHFMD